MSSAFLLFCILGADFSILHGWLIRAFVFSSCKILWPFSFPCLMFRIPCLFFEHSLILKMHGEASSSTYASTAAAQEEGSLGSVVAPASVTTVERASGRQEATVGNMRSLCSHPPTYQLTRTMKNIGG